MGKLSSARRRRARIKVINPLSAGIDIGSRFHVVAIPQELDSVIDRKYSSFTKDLIALAEWLLAVGMNTVAMKLSSSVNGMNLFQQNYTPRCRWLDLILRMA